MSMCSLRAAREAGMSTCTKCLPITKGAVRRWWMNEVIQDIFENGYLQGYYLDAVRKGLVHYWPSPAGSPPILRQWAVGKFSE